EVLVRGRHRRRQPDGVHAEPQKLVKPGAYPAQVAVAVSVGGPPRPDVQLSHRGALPPAPSARVLIHLSPDLRSPSLRGSPGGSARPGFWPRGRAAAAGPRA